MKELWTIVRVVEGGNGTCSIVVLYVDYARSLLVAAANHSERHWHGYGGEGPPLDLLRLQNLRLGF